MNNHIFVDTIINHFGSEESKTYYQHKKEIVNGDDALIMKPVTEITHYLRNKFKNHTLLGNVDGRNFYAFDTTEGILVVYPPIPFSTKPALQASHISFYKTKEEAAQEFLPNKEDTLYDYESHEEIYAKVLKNLDLISPQHDDSNNLKNIIGRIESIRKSNAPIIFDKVKNSL